MTIFQNGPLPSHRVYMMREYFGCRVYHPGQRLEHFFNPADTNAITRVYAGEDAVELGPTTQQLRDKGLLTSNIVIIPQRSSTGLGSPLKVCGNLTKLCNLRCRHCLSNASTRDPHELTYAEYQDVFRQMRQGGTFFVTFGGGEPLMREDVSTILACAIDHDIATSIVTNGTLVTKDMAIMLESLRLDSITVSFDGMRGNHEYIRGKGQFNAAVRGFRLLREYCPSTTLAVRMTVNSRNIHECETVIRLAEDMGANLIRLTPILLFGRALNNTSLALTAPQYAQFLHSTARIESRIKVQLPRQGDSRKFFVTANDFGCHCGKESTWLDLQGDVYPCIFFGDGYKAGNVRESSLSALWERCKSSVRLCGNPQCLQCSQYSKCRGDCRARALAMGDINAPDPLCPHNYK